jgi:hypothetical protein
VRHQYLAILFGAAAIAVPLALSDASAAPSSSQCFLSSEWAGWKPTPDSRAIYIRVSVNRLYRLDLAYACPMLQQPDVHLVTRLTGSWVCHPLDLDLRVADTHGFMTACTVSKITPLSPEEAKALPRNLRP